MMAKADWVGKPFGLPYFPLTPTFPWLGPLGVVPLPTKWSIDFGEPIDLRGPRPGGRRRPDPRQPHLRAGAHRRSRGWSTAAWRGGGRSGSASRRPTRRFSCPGSRRAARPPMRDSSRSSDASSARARPERCGCRAGPSGTCRGSAISHPVLGEEPPAAGLVLPEVRERRAVAVLGDDAPRAVAHDVVAEHPQVVAGGLDQQDVDLGVLAAVALHAVLHAAVEHDAHHLVEHPRDPAVAEVAVQRARARCRSGTGTIGLMQMTRSAPFWMARLMCAVFLTPPST